MSNSLAFKHHTADAVTFAKNSWRTPTGQIVYPAALLTYSFSVFHRVARIRAGDGIWLPQWAMLCRML